MAEKEQKPSIAVLVKQVVRKAEEPITAVEILRRVHRLRPIDMRSPESTIRNAIGQCYLVANAGDGRYGWYPRLIKGSLVRVPLIASDLDQSRIIFDDAVREMLWPSFFASHDNVDQEPVKLELPGDIHTRLPLDHFGNGVWGTTGSPEFRHRLRVCEVVGGDSLILEGSGANNISATTPSSCIGSGAIAKGRG